MSMNIDQAGGIIHTQAVVSFYNGVQINDGKTASAGRPIYDDVEMIRIQWAGNTKSELHAPASDRSDRPIVNREDQSRYWPKWKDHPDFKAAYEAFKAGNEHVVNGTPVSELPFLTDARRLELKAINILTAEQLAAVDINTKLGRDLVSLRQQAAVYLQRAAGAAVDAQHEMEKAAMQAQVDELKAQMAQLLTATSSKAPVAAKKAVTPAQEHDPVYATFDSFDDDSLRAYLTDATGEAPHNRCGHAKLVEMAVEADRKMKAASQIAA
jgi:hypothetical protein